MLVSQHIVQPILAQQRRRAVHICGAHYQSVGANGAARVMGTMCLQWLLSSLRRGSHGFRHAFAELVLV